MSKGDFFRQSLRITVMQILRGIGFDRAPPQLIDILTDIYIRHLLLLTSEAQELSQLCGRDSLQIQDITQALINVGMLKPSNLLDVYEQGYEEDQTAKGFLNWCVGHVTENQRMVSKPSVVVGEAKGKVGDVSTTTFGGSMMTNTQQTMDDKQEKEDGEEQGEADEDWLSYHMKRGGKLHSVKMYDVTELRPDVGSKSEVVVSGPTPDALLDKLPASIKKQSELLEKELLYPSANGGEDSGMLDEEPRHFAAGYDAGNSSYY